jgi:hypothetical protein
MKGVIFVCLALWAVVLTGCTNPDLPSSVSSSGSSVSPQNPGEPAAPAPPSPGAQSAVAVQPTATQALAAFARLYVNWSYRTLSANQRALAGMSVGAARLSERQAAVSSQHDTTIARGQIWNRGEIVSVDRDLTAPGAWVIVTREQTGGNTQYEGLPESYHVTIAHLAIVAGGFAVQEWLPQS